MADTSDSSAPTLPTSPVLSAEDEPIQTSQFVGGLVLGVVLGTAGYYFLATPEGQRLRQKLVTRWQAMGEAMETETAGSKLDWTDRLKAGLQRVAAELGVGGPLAFHKDKAAASRLALPKARTTSASTTVLTPQRTKTKATRARAKFRGV